MNVLRTTEYERIAAMPRRVLSLDEAERLADEMTPRFARVRGARLLPWQAVSIREAVECQGAWLALPVGQGKTLISWLLPTALSAQRTLLLVPGALRDKTTVAFRELSESWVSPPGALRIETREKLSVASGAALLDQYQPDLVVVDESDMLSSTRSAATRRIDRYLHGRPHVRVVAMSGTPARKSIMGYWHLLWWCLRNTGAPLPATEGEARMWALALDDHRGRRPGFGPLGTTLRTAREWYRRRLIETPGVVVVDEDSCTAPLTIRTRIAREDPILDAAYEIFLVDCETPGGMPISDPLSRWRLDGQLGLGLYTRWNPPPPDAWYEARREVARFVRDKVDASRWSSRPLDTEAQVFARYPDAPAVKRWQDIRPTFEGVTETVWISRSALDSCIDWLRELPSGVPGIVWCGSHAFAQALARDTGLMYYGAGGRTADGQRLIDAPPTRSLIASWNANMKGFNLQPWARQLVTMPPQSSKWLEQIFGRSHRRGQTEPVTVDILATSGGTLDLFEAAISEATKVRDNESLTQKILRADITRAEPNRTERNQFRWARRTQ